MAIVAQVASKKFLTTQQKMIEEHIAKNCAIISLTYPKIATSQGDDHTTDCLLHYVHFKNYHKMIAIDLSKQ